MDTPPPSLSTVVFEAAQLQREKIWNSAIHRRKPMTLKMCNASIAVSENRVLRIALILHHIKIWKFRHRIVHPKFRVLLSVHNWTESTTVARVFTPVGVLHLQSASSAFPHIRLDPAQAAALRVASLWQKNVQTFEVWFFYIVELVENDCTDLQSTKNARAPRSLTVTRQKKSWKKCEIAAEGVIRSRWLNAVGFALIS